ncbi:AAA family ATPase [Kitasatospora sp. NPDC057015]|uniref:helix-turn-helix transcriptional regulator n=1 Tax=Kitasatospora sp. NPDC057015 TaxID=3346001 RepID=UPI00363C271E
MDAGPTWRWAPGQPLRGREHESAALADALSGARAGHGEAVLLVGDPGAGRTSVLAAAARAATGFAPQWVAGTEAESATALAGLQRLLLPLAPRIRELPAGQARLLDEVAAGPPPGPGESGLALAVLGLLGRAGRERPVLWCVDDAQWLDAPTLRVLGFVARRLVGLPVVLAFAAEPGGRAVAELGDLRTVPLDPLRPGAVAELLADLGGRHWEPELLGEITDLAEGNPLALVELAASAAAGSPGPPALPPAGRLRARYRRRLGALSAAARGLVWLVAIGDRLPVAELLASARAAGAGPEALDEARASGLVLLDASVATVPGRLVRSCLLADVPLADRQAAHAALARAAGPHASPLLRAVHRLALAQQPLDDLTAALDLAAAAARGAGDPGASAAALERAAEVLAHPQDRARCLVTAAADRLAAGDPRRSRALLRRVPPQGAAPATGGLRMLVRGEIELRDGVPATAHRALCRAGALLAGAAERGPSVRALVLAGEASCLAGDFRGYFELAERARSMRREDDPPQVRLGFDHIAGMAATYQGRHHEATRALRRVVRLAEAVPDPESAIWASQAAYTLGDARRAHALAVRAAFAAGELGAVALVPGALVYQALAALMLDRHAAAEAAATEGLRLAEATGQRNLAVDHVAVLALSAALQGDRAAAAPRLRAAAPEVATRELGRPSAFNCWTSACLDLSDDRPADALDRFARMASGAGQTNLAIRGMAAPHFVEAAARCGQRARAEGALRSFEAWAASSGSAARLALAHRCHGLVAETDTVAEEHFREALRLHRDDDAALELAKTEFFFARRLRRARRPSAARGLLRDAVAVFQQFDARPWADRATAELRAAGAGVSPAAVPAGTDLTAQQSRICGLVARGATNREIADVLLLSTRTVEYHLRNVFSRLGVRSRVELAALFH